jgi:hypothetical protein
MREIKRIGMVVVAILLSEIMVLGISTAMAGEPQDIIEKSSGYPIGFHSKLNIHGKDTLTFSCEAGLPGRKAIFIDEYDESTIQDITNKKSPVRDLAVSKTCTGCFNDPPDDLSAKVILPYEEEGFYFFSGVRAKPHKELNDDDTSSILLYQNLVIKTHNDTYPSNPDFPHYIENPDDPILTSKLSNIRYLYTATPERFVRFDPETSKVKEKTMAMDVTRLLLKWLGRICEADIVDTNEDGDIDVYVFRFIIKY